MKRRRYHVPVASPLAERLDCPCCHRATVEVGWLALTLRCRPCGLLWHGVADYEAAVDIARRQVHELPSGGAA
jgi:hypothetical protein